MIWGWWAVMSVGHMVLGAYVARLTYWDWAALCWFVAGWFWCLFLQAIDAARRRRRAMKADQAMKEAQALGESWKRANVCNCAAPAGYPHEPDCVWWDRNCK